MYNDTQKLAKRITTTVAISWWLTAITLVVSKILFSLPDQLRFMVSTLCIFCVIASTMSAILINVLLYRKKKLAIYEQQSPDYAPQRPIPPILQIIMPIMGLLSAPIIVSLLIYTSQAK